jgi:hypothetical protein
MYKSTLSRQARRNVVKAIKSAALKDENPIIDGGICQYISYVDVPEQKHRFDIRHAISETLGEEVFLPDAVIPYPVCNQQNLRTAMRMKFLRLYAEQGVAYTPFEWLTKVDSRFAKWRSEVNKIAAKYNLVPAVIPSVREQEVWTKHYMDNLTPQQAWDATPCR